MSECTTSAVLLGHDETLIVHVGAGGARPRHYPEEFRRWGHLRLSVGLEARATWWPTWRRR